MLSLKEKEQKVKSAKGITLVVLVITIIILLILATISIQKLTNTGLFAKAKETRDKTANAEENQARTLNEYEDELNKYISGDIKTTVKKVANNIGSVLSTTDNTELEDEYGNKIVIPAGFKIVSDDTTNNAQTVDKGIVIEDVTETATKGSQFVWIPIGKIKKEDGSVTTISLNRYTFDENGNPIMQEENTISEGDTGFKELSSSNKGNIVSKNISNFKTSAIKNNGYYIGRYEARTNTARNSENNQLTQITEKVTEYIYNYVTQPQAAQLSQNMYNSSKYVSDLTNSYAYDTTILFLQNCGTNNKYSRKNSSNSGTLAQKGTTEDVQCNVYDMASNVGELTTETTEDENSPCGSRGGNYIYDGSYASCRGYHTTSYSYELDGFRPILYINI